MPAGDRGDAVHEAFERARREAVATGLRMQATTLKGLAETMRRHAEDLERHAGSIEKGAKPKARNVAQRGEEPGDAPRLEHVDGELLQQSGVDALAVSEEMKDWLRGFHERYRRSPHFADAVNSVAGMPMNADTAEAVAGLVMARAGQDPDLGGAEHG